jgi:hypothetical protein
MSTVDELFQLNIKQELQDFSVELGKLGEVEDTARSNDNDPHTA